MNPTRLLEHFDRIAEAPNAVTRLRRFILDLAVRGKLLDQDKNDEPVVELLERIAAEKAQLSKEGQIKKEKPVTSSEVIGPYDLPETWQWVPLGRTVISHLGGGTPSKNNSLYWGGEIYWASVKDIGKSKYVNETIDKITEEGLANSSSNLIPAGNLIIVTRMGLGKLSINRVPIAINQDLRALSLTSFAAIDYYFNFFKTHSFEGTGLTVKGIKVAELLNMPFPLPPLAEQNRIVAKVNELMALCDQLEEAQNQREAQRDRLVAASLHRIQNQDLPGSAPKNGQKAWFEKDFLQHFPRFTTRPEHMEQLRQTLLNLAVCGRLLPQDPSDESAAELLKHIRAKRGVKRKYADLCIEELESPLPEIPDNWIWTVTDQIAEDSENAITDGPFGANLKTAHYVTNPGYRVVRLENIGPRKFREEHLTFIDADRFDRLKKHHVRPGNLVVAGLVSPTIRCCEIPSNIGHALVKADCYKFAVHPALCARYVLHYLNSIIAQRFAAAHHHGMTLIRLGLGNFRRIPFPLPPVSEQLRISSRVDELFGLCDELETRLAESQSDNKRLLMALLREAI